MADSTARRKITVEEKPTPDGKVIEVDGPIRPDEMPAGVQRARRLHILTHSIDPCPPWVRELSDLTDLQITYQGYEELQDVRLHGSLGLRSATVRGSIHQISLSLAAPHRLSKLDIARTMIRTLSDEMAALSGLEELTVDYPVATLPGWLSNLTLLRRLGLAGTLITELPDIIAHLTALEELDVSRTKLTTLPAVVGFLRNLRVLAANDTPITSIAPEVGDLSNLRSLDLSGAEHLITSDDVHAPAHIVYRATAGGEVDSVEVMATVTDCAIFRLWSRSKVVYAMDDLLLGYLSETISSPIPTEILQQLPHPDPYILLPKPDLDDPQTAYYRTHINVPVGAFVFGRYNQAQQLTSTADAKREDLGLMFIGFRDTDRGPELVTLRCTIPLRGPTFRVEDAVSATIAKFRFNDHLQEDDPAKLEGWLRNYVAQAFNSLLYVCTDQPDIEIYKPRAGQHGKQAKREARKRPRPDDIGAVVKLGFRMGPALYQARTQWERNPPAQPGAVGSERRVRPHRKKGHYRTYWTGQGRTQPILKWIAPFWVNEGLLGAAASPKDVVVRPVRGKSI